MTHTRINHFQAMPPNPQYGDTIEVTQTGMTFSYESGEGWHPRSSLELKKEDTATDPYATVPVSRYNDFLYNTAAARVASIPGVKYETEYSYYEAIRVYLEEMKANRNS